MGAHITGPIYCLALRTNLLQCCCPAVIIRAIYSLALNTRELMQSASHCILFLMNSGRAIHHTAITFASGGKLCSCLATSKQACGWQWLRVYENQACAVLRRSAAAPDAAEHDEEARKGCVLHRLGSAHPARPPLHLWQPEQCCRQLGLPCHLKPQSEPCCHQPGAICEAQVSSAMRHRHACSIAS